MEPGAIDIFAAEPGAIDIFAVEPGAIRIDLSSDSNDEDEDLDDVGDNSDGNTSSSGTISGDEDAPYGGYGACYVCGHRGHWAPGCPRRYY